MRIFCAGSKLADGKHQILSQAQAAAGHGSADDDGEARQRHRMAQVPDEASPAAAEPASPTPGQPRQAQCWPSGIRRCTDATWRPHPPHVDLPHAPHFTS
ncbi:hypothetical protein ABZP36_006664 [Zizania latifolia]